MNLGRFELHGLRDYARILYKRGRGQPHGMGETGCRSRCRRNSANMHIPFVRHLASHPKNTPLTNYSDVLRRRFQVNTMSGMGYQYNSIGGAISTILKQEGFMGLYKGITPNLMKVAPSMAASWWTFEFVRDLLVQLSPREPI
jgi:hypothetical protein